MIDKESLPYRACVGVVLLNADNRVWVGQRIPKDWDKHSEFLWQMPQGGIDDGEDPKKAAMRELYEETGVKNTDLVAEIPGWLSYDLPDEILGKALKGKYRGQKQKWFALRFTGDETEINLSPPDHPAEFQQWRWAEIRELPGLIISFKRPVYEQLVLELDKIL